jgi:hypothetical protein
MIRIRCRRCDRKWGLADSEAGQAWRCPACRQEAVLPGLKVTSSPRPSRAETKKRRSGKEVSVPSAPLERQPTIPVTLPAAPALPPLPATAPFAAMADSNIALIDSSAAIETEYSRPASKHAAMMDSSPVIEMVSEIRPPVGNPGEEPYEISDRDLARAEVLGLAPTPVVPTTVVASLRDLGTLEDEPVRVASRKKKKKIDWQRNLGWQRDVLFVLGPLAFLWLILTVSSFMNHRVAWGMMVLGLLVYGAGKIAIILDAASEGMIQGVLCVIPFYTPWYFLFHWRQVLRSFLFASAGALLFGTAVAFTSHYGLVNPIESMMKVDSSDVDARLIALNVIGGGVPGAGQGQPRVIRAPGSPVFGKNPEQALADLADGPGAAEAKNWLESSDKHVLTHGTRAEAVRRVTELYKLGAKRVTVVEIVDVPDQFRPGDRVHTSHQEAHHVVIEMPDDNASRRKIFDFIAKALGQDFPAEENGQKYLDMELGT